MEGQELLEDVLEEDKTNNLLPNENLDPGIRDTVRKLNNHGFKTIQSCDGIADNHPERSELRPGWISLEKTPKTIDLLAACFREKKNLVSA